LLSKAHFLLADNLKRVEFSAGFIQYDWLLKQQRFEWTKMSGKKVGKYSTFGGKNFVRLNRPRIEGLKAFKSRSNRSSLTYVTTES